MQKDTVGRRRSSCCCTQCIVKGREIIITDNTQPISLHHRTACLMCPPLLFTIFPLFACSLAQHHIRQNVQFIEQLVNIHTCITLSEFLSNCILLQRQLCIRDYVALCCLCRQTDRHGLAPVRGQAHILPYKMLVSCSQHHPSVGHIKTPYIPRHMQPRHSHNYLFNYCYFGSWISCKHNNLERAEWTHLILRMRNSGQNLMRQQCDSSSP